MKTAFRLPDWPFQEKGDICKSCEKFWNYEELPPQKMEAVYGVDGVPIRTRERGIPIVGCRFCDGELLFDLPKTLP